MVDLEVKSKPKVAWVFPGQGSQSVGMGYNLYQNSRKAREVFDEADSALQIPLSRLCFEGPGEELRDTINAQPAILTTCVACLRAASEFGLSLRPSFVAGHSLGEYTALVAADVIDFADAVRLVRERGRLMQQAGKSTPGGMAAIMGLDEASLEEVCLETGAQSPSASRLSDERTGPCTSRPQTARSAATGGRPFYRKACPRPNLLPLPTSASNQWLRDSCFLPDGSTSTGRQSSS